MKRLHFDYSMRIDYSETVNSCHFTIKCLPQDTLRQKVKGLSIALSPLAPYSVGEDSFGNRQIYGTDDIPHDVFSFRIIGDAKTGCGLWEENALRERIPVFRHPYGRNRPGEALCRYHAQLTLPPLSDDYEKGLFLMHRLHGDFAYEKECTGMSTTAEEAWKLGKGVCQDYAHILISLLHMEGIPARYVTGMLPGEGASHAWVEVLQDGKWYGLDPTNDKAVAEEYIKIGTGRDAGDCLINRGIMRGGGKQAQTVQVVVREAQGHDRNSSGNSAAGR